jgi:hypothetical protein
MEGTPCAAKCLGERRSGARGEALWAPVGDRSTGGHAAGLSAATRYRRKDGPLSFDEHLRAAERADGAEDAHPIEPMSTFDESLDFHGFLSGPPSKMLIPPLLSTLDDDEHLRAPTSPAAVSGETRESRAAFAKRSKVPRTWVEGTFQSMMTCLRITCPSPSR